MILIQFSIQQYAKINFENRKARGHFEDSPNAKLKIKDNDMIIASIIPSQNFLFVSKIIFSSTELYIGQQNYFLANYNNNTKSFEQRINKKQKS
ncbi:hypothetical protein BpHYR1_001137 [Brachionus plicatilis]|uniref:Uncharacterized protein n=1 Tax=Brachionus plicatilis TaxID=10195 RepID=A0A3M7QJT9_BRAPC|nr:hypothetical protein BpHYR1_001137 [Brachionus plicatilis]